MVKFGQIIMGPPGSGKSTYCAAMEYKYNSIGRHTIIVNLDPQVTPEELPYKPTVDVCDLVDASKVSDTFELGPNATLLYCMEYLLENVDWLIEKLSPFKDSYILYDIPGQIELFTHHTSLRDVIQKLEKNGHRLVGVNLIDSTLCADPYKYIAALLSSLSCQIFVQLPHVNILSKLSLLKIVKKDLAYKLEYYTEANDLQELMVVLRNGIHMPNQERFEKFTSTLCELIEDFNLVSFGTLDVQDNESIERVIRIIDRSSGYIANLGDSFPHNRNVYDFSFSNNITDDVYLKNNVADLQERYVDSDE
ncbi:ATP binding protein family member protein [Theileria equi strain WA]|uniref:GPN-loop GTPase 2 n=1 Tax=Theileria equi strain WA TaxID=1537102 RepID=L1LFH7_THEEQ|nr:ATP binding protein family member protein [Theileria equi strain WA]EKX74187.1 ATP binding protein family member protein [Theileria equi strain WA]|eukprot:XP_004833639.1 ATP binding protein family member protein [Theileria equi strain WA]